MDKWEKRLDSVYDSGTLYTKVPKMFLKYYVCNEVLECGICLSGEAISRVQELNTLQTNAKVEQSEDKHIPFSTAKEAILKYKLALKVIDVEDADRIFTFQELWSWIKKDMVDMNKSSFITFGLLWLFSEKSLSYTAWLAALCLLCNLDYYEVYRMVCAIFVSYDKKKAMEDAVIEMGLGEIVSAPFKREDLKLYMKIKDGNFRFK